MAHNAQIERAIAHLRAQKEPNIAATAREFAVARETLSKRFHRKTSSRAQVTATYHMKLSPAQEEVLVAHINKLSDRGLPPTPRIVRNLAKELSKSDVGVNWVSRFCARHKNELTSVYLRTIDHKRKIADNSHHFEHYFKIVCHSASFLLNDFKKLGLKSSSYSASREDQQIQHSALQYLQLR
jgi:Tc5 transposase DNA-binding domain